MDLDRRYPMLPAVVIALVAAYFLLVPFVLSDSGRITPEEARTMALLPSAKVESKRAPLPQGTTPFIQFAKPTPENLAQAIRLRVVRELDKPVYYWMNVRYATLETLAAAVDKTSGAEILKDGKVVGYRSRDKIFVLEAESGVSSGEAHKAALVAIGKGYKMLPQAAAP